jgi:hypothetical protein
MNSMPNQQKPQQTEPFGNMRQSFNMFWLVTSGYATCILPFLRRGFGTHFFGFNALVAPIIMLLFGAAEHSDDMLRYMLIWVLVVAIRRMQTFAAKQRGQVIHSRYAGDSWLASKQAPKANRKKLQTSLEPALILLAAAVMFPLSMAVGKFLFFGGFAVAIFNLMTRAVVEQQVRQMHDAHIQQVTARRVFRGQDDDF